MHAPTERAMPADAPGTTRAASTPSRSAIFSPLRSRSSVIEANVPFASCTASRTVGESTEPPRSV
jgi:hypothetical protein